jgi:hypothetical protein
MDLNYLYQRHQISLFRSEHAACPQSREAHRRMALGYATKIDQARSAGGFQLMAVA